MMPSVAPTQLAPLQERLHALTRKSERIASTIAGKVAEMQRGGLPWGEAAQGLSTQAMASLELARGAAAETENVLVELDLGTPEAHGVEEALQELRGALGHLRQRLGLLLLQELTAPTSFRSPPSCGNPAAGPHPRAWGAALKAACLEE